MKDMLNLVHPVRAISPVSVADKTAQVSAIIDRQGYESLTFILGLGAIADPDATFTVSMDHGAAANLSDAAAVPSTELVGTTALAGFQFDDENETRKIGYRGIKRYVRLTITPTGNSAAALISAIALLGHPAQVPTINPPM
jgi:hypothetical protein